MNKPVFTILAGAMSAMAVNLALAQSVTQRNGVLADANGRTLYTFDKDAANKSNCYGGCAAAWPPFFARDGASANAGFSIIPRDDGSKQWAKDGKPLYYFAADASPGEVKGDGQGSVWHVIRAADKQAASQPAARQSGYGSHGSSGSYGGY